MIGKNGYISDAATSTRMRQVASSNTSIEQQIGRMLDRLRFRYDTHRRDLPGCPDFVFVRRRKIVLIHGCFWHRHRCRRATMPRRNVERWREKFQATVRRDRRNLRLLREAGWTVLVLWECEIRVEDDLKAALSAFLSAKARSRT